jgi:hypothetical protein
MLELFVVIFEVFVLILTKLEAILFVFVINLPNCL